MSLSEVVVDIVVPEQEARFRALMQAHHYLGALPKIGETLWYVAHLNGTWLALAVFSAAALKCRARDAWVGWDFRTQYGRLHLVSNNTRLLLLPGRHPNLGSRVLGLCARRIVRDWPARFGHPLLLLEALALDCYSILRNSGLLGKVMKIRHLLELWIFLPVFLHRARLA